MTESGAEGTMCWKEVTVTNKLGFHARPAAMLAKVASQFDCEVIIEKEGLRVSAKSVMGLLGLEAGQGTVLRVECDGCDSVEALGEVVRVIEQGFGE